jgi:hypothetical protein
VPTQVTRPDAPRLSWRRGAGMAIEGQRSGWRRPNTKRMLTMYYITRWPLRPHALAAQCHAMQAQPRGVARFHCEDRCGWGCRYWRYRLLGARAATGMYPWLAWVWGLMRYQRAASGEGFYLGAAPIWLRNSMREKKCFHGVYGNRRGSPAAVP